MDASSTHFNIIRNPALYEKMAQAAMSTKENVEQAVQAAQEAFHHLRETAPASRAKYLFNLKELIENYFEELSTVQVKEHGKTIDEERGETIRGIENVELCCNAPSWMMGESLRNVAMGGG